jgi:hypothetical protein
LWLRGSPGGEIPTRMRVVGGVANPVDWWWRLWLCSLATGLVGPYMGDFGGVVHY